MKLKLKISALLISLSSIAYSQQKEKNDYMVKDRIGLIHLDTSFIKKNCRIILKRENKPDQVADFIIMNDNDWIHQEISHNKATIELYKSPCITLINLKPGVILISYKQLLELYHISKKDFNLNLFVDGLETPYKNILVVKSAIVSLKIIEDKIADKRYIVINTTHLRHGHKKIPKLITDPDRDIPVRN